MKRKALKYDQAVEAYRKTYEETRAVPQQPNRQLSEMHGTTWFLRNVAGPLAQVNCRGAVLYAHRQGGLQ